MNPTRPRVLMIAYACEPGRGSEPAVGWTWACQAARHADVTVITRSNNHDVIAADLARQPRPGLSFAYADLPQPLRFWKRKARGALAYSLAWQVPALVEALALHRERPFDLVHHVTFVQPYLPALASLLPIPLVWGPIGANRPIPPAFAREVLEPGERALDLARVVLEQLQPVNLPTRLAREKASALIAIDPYVAESFPESLRRRTRVLPSNFQEPFPGADPSRPAGEFRVLMVGNLIGIKGFRLGVRAFARFARATGGPASLEIVGDGPDRETLRGLTRESGVADRVTFSGTLSRDAARETMARAHVLVHPSFEGGGQVVLEALAAGTPVVCLDRKSVV